jgi:hypothetical protein
MRATSNLAPLAGNTTDPRHNARKITAVLTGEADAVDLYRKIMAGPSGQRTDLHVARVRPVPYGTDEVAIIDPRTGDRAGAAHRAIHDGGQWWSITEETYDGWRWRGYAETLSGGADWLINGVHAATGRHDSRRISPAAVRTADQVHAANARKHTAHCAPCRDAGQSKGWIDCVAR